MENWPEYISHKKVHAAKIVAKQDGVLYVDQPTADVQTPPFFPTEPAMAARAQVGWYAVVYDGGRFKSVSPPEEFDRGYTLADHATLTPKD